MAETSQTLQAPEHLESLRRAPAAHLADQLAAAEVTGRYAVRAQELPFRPQLGIRTVPGTASSEAIEQALEVELPEAGNSTGDLQGHHVLWLSPDEFLSVDVSRTQRPGEESAAQHALEGLPGQVLDLSGNRTIFELSGPSAVAVLQKGCHLDMHPGAFTIGNVAATVLGPVQVYLHRSAEDTYRIYPRSSFADYVGRWLLDSMLEFGSLESVDQALDAEVGNHGTERT